MARKRVKRDYVIIGLNSFGENLALALEDMGHNVLGIDRDRKVVQRLSDNIQDIISLDATDYETLLSLGIDAFETAIVSVGGDLAQAVLITLTLKELGVKRVVCEAQSEHDRRVLLRIGADEVVTPAIESARAVAYHLTGRTARSTRLRFANQVAIKWRPPGSFSGTLGELMARYSADIQVMLLAGRSLEFNPAPETLVSPGDDLLLVGPEEAMIELIEEMKVGD